MNFDDLKSSYMSCSIKCQYDEEKSGLFYELDTPVNSDVRNFNNFYNLCLKMTPIQRQFFAEPTNIIDMDNQDDQSKPFFVYCPGNYLNSFYPQRENYPLHNYKELRSEEKMYIMKWIFSVACSIKILLENSIKPIYITDKTIFIDSKMNARYLYDYWKESELNSSVIKPHYYYFPPEVISNQSLYTDDHEKSCSYSFGILILSLLNQRHPCSYFKNLTKNQMNDLIEKGTFLSSKIPEDCKIKNLLKSLISVKKDERMDILSVIKYLLDSKNCIEDVNHKDFIDFVKEKFKINKDIDNTKLFEIIEKNLCKVDENAVKEVQYEKLKLSDLPYFLKLASNTIYGEKLKKQYDYYIDTYFYKQLKEDLKKHYDKNKTEENKFSLMNNCLEHISDFTLNLVSNLGLFYVENMVNDLAFYIKISQVEKKIRLVIPNEIIISSDYIQKFNNNHLFVQVYDDSNNNQKEIDFYPYLNIYNILYNLSSKKSIEFQQKVKWLYQTASALSLLHEQNLSMINFNCKNVYIDLNMNAHLFPSNLFNMNTENKISLQFDLSEKSNFELSHYAPEFILNERLINPEKSLVYSFGIFMIELLYGFLPDFFINKNISYSEKMRILTRPKKVSNENVLSQIAQSCLESDYNVRKSFKQIIFELESYIKANNLKIENNETYYHFQLDDLETAFINGASITDKIFDCLYNWLDINGKFNFNLYMSSNPINYTKFDIMMKLLNEKEIKNSEFKSMNIVQPIQKSTKNTQSIQKSEDKKEKLNLICKQFALNYVYKLDEGMKNVRNKSGVKYMHLNGLTQNSTRQLLMRYGLIQDYKFRHKIEFVVKNKENYPYGTPIKMNAVKSIVDEFINKGFYKNLPSFSQNPKGNIIMDLSIPLFDNANDKKI